jgi:hypothetical protein
MTVPYDARVLYGNEVRDLNALERAGLVGSAAALRD